jgi:hypothetical protein
MKTGDLRPKTGDGALVTWGVTRISGVKHEQEPNIESLQHNGAIEQRAIVMQDEPAILYQAVAPLQWIGTLWPVTLVTLDSLQSRPDAALVKPAPRHSGPAGSDPSR